jgi:hypothetical protein
VTKRLSLIEPIVKNEGRTSVSDVTAPPLFFLFFVHKVSGLILANCTEPYEGAVTQCEIKKKRLVWQQT